MSGHSYGELGQKSLNIYGWWTHIIQGKNPAKENLVFFTRIKPTPGENPKKKTAPTQAKHTVQKRNITPKETKQKYNSDNNNNNNNKITKTENLEN